jgi:hypothetical protein
MLFASIRLGKYGVGKTNEYEEPFLDTGLNRIRIVPDLGYVIGGKKL